jgi:serine/threonine protein kinase
MRPHGLFVCSTRLTKDSSKDRERLRRRLGHTTLDGTVRPEGEFLSSKPRTPPPSQRISTTSLSPGYFAKVFTERKVLGRGGKGVVLLVEHFLDRVPLGLFACKRVPVGQDHQWLEKVLLEVKLLQGLNHPNIVSYRHVWLEEMKLSEFSPEIPCAFILQQYCDGGDLQRYVLGNDVKITKELLKQRMRSKSIGKKDATRLPDDSRILPIDEIYSFFRDIASGLNFLHEHGFIHRDLKPSNCLLHETSHGWKVLVSDFGEVQAENAARSSTGATGTISYCAPEVLKLGADGTYNSFTTKSDIYSVGLILYFMCFSALPYKNANIHEEMEDLAELRVEIVQWPGFEDSEGISSRPDLPREVFIFLKKLLALNPTERPSAGEIIEMTSSWSPDGNATPGKFRSGSQSGTNSYFDATVQKPRISDLDIETDQQARSFSPSRRRGSTTQGTSNGSRNRIDNNQSQFQAYFEAAVYSDDDDDDEESSPTKRERQALILRNPATPKLLNNDTFSTALVPYQRSSRPTRVSFAATSLFILRCLMFVLKLYSLRTLCVNSSYESVSFLLYYPLLTLAAIDLSLSAGRGATSFVERPRSSDWIGSLILSIFHWGILLLIGHDHACGR